MTQNNDENGDLPDRFMKQLSQTALQDMLAAAIAGTLKNRRAGIRRIYIIHYIKNSAKVVRIMNFMHPPPSCLRTWMERNVSLEVNFVDDGVEQKPLPANERDSRSDELPTFERNACNVYARRLHLSTSCLQRVCLRQFAFGLLTVAGPAHTFKAYRGFSPAYSSFLCLGNQQPWSDYLAQNCGSCCRL